MNFETNPLDGYDIQKEVDHIAINAHVQVIQENNRLIQSIFEGKIPPLQPGEMRTLITDSNFHIKEIFGDDEEGYQEARFHLLLTRDPQSGRSVYRIMQGYLIPTDPE